MMESQKKQDTLDKGKVKKLVNLANELGELEEQKENLELKYKGLAREFAELKEELKGEMTGKRSFRVGEQVIFMSNTLFAIVKPEIIE